MSPLRSAESPPRRTGTLPLALVSNVPLVSVMVERTGHRILQRPIGFPTR